MRKTTPDAWKRGNWNTLKHQSDHGYQQCQMLHLRQYGQNIVHPCPNRVKLCVQLPRRKFLHS